MDLQSALASGLPIAIGSATGADADDREDSVDTAALLRGAAERQPDAVEVVQNPSPADLVPASSPPAAQPRLLEDEVEHILARIETIEERLHKKLGLHCVHEALDRIDALLT